MSEIKKKWTVKDKLKQLAPYWIISFVFCYMLFIYEPLIMYGTNKHDFWFDFGIMVKPMTGIFLIFFLGLAVFFTVLFFLSKRLSAAILLLVFAAFILFYIQGNFLTQNLPPLDGSEIDWSVYAFSKDTFIMAAIGLVIEAALIFAVIKFDLEKLLIYGGGVSLAVFVMLNTSLVSVAVKNDLFQSKNSFISSTYNFNEASSDKNFFIFVVDTQNTAEFMQVLSEYDEFRKTFDDFTLFSDAASIYPHTRDSLVQILSGKVNKNEEDFGTFSSNAYNNSVLFKELDDRGYDIYLYSPELVWYGEKTFNIKNNSGSEINAIDTKEFYKEFFNNEMSYVWFKYLPYSLKKLSKIENLNFQRCFEMFSTANDSIYYMIKGTELTRSPRAQFRFIHAEGGHTPFDMNVNMERVGNLTYYDKVSASVHLVTTFIERLKEAGVYDNSVIIVMGDHGAGVELGPDEIIRHLLSRVNPVLLIKGRGEKHELMYSDKPVSYMDLPDAYTDLLNGKASTELFPEAEYPRTRKVLWCEWLKEEHMVEYQTDGRANEWDKFVETGEVFDLPKN